MVGNVCSSLLFVSLVSFSFLYKCVFRYVNSGLGLLKTLLVKQKLGQYAENRKRTDACQIWPYRRMLIYRGRKRKLINLFSRNQTFIKRYLPYTIGEFCTFSTSTVENIIKSWRTRSRRRYSVRWTDQVEKELTKILYLVNYVWGGDVNSVTFSNWNTPMFRFCLTGARLNVYVIIFVCIRCI